MAGVEHFCRDGALLLTPNRFGLLQGLLDRPGATAQSRDDWIRAAIPHIRRFRDEPNYWTVAKTIRKLPSLWVRRRRVGNQWLFTLQKRGRSILEGTVPARIQGAGPYVPVNRRESGRRA